MLSRKCSNVVVVIETMALWKWKGRLRMHRHVALFPSLDVSCNFLAVTLQPYGEATIAMLAVTLLLQVALSPN